MTKRRKRCYGFPNPRECDRAPGKNPVWCDECNRLRIAHISKQMNKLMTESFGRDG